MGVMDVLSELDPMALLGKMLGVLIIIGSMLNKAPLFVNILKSKSVTGISSSSIYSEAIMYSNAALYCVRLGHPFTAYGETLLIAAQTLMVIMLIIFEDNIIHFDKKIFLCCKKCKKTNFDENEGEDSEIGINENGNLSYLGPGKGKKEDKSEKIEIIENKDEIVGKKK